MSRYRKRHAWARSFLPLLLLASACATGRATEAYDHERSEPPLTVHWRYTRTERDVLVANGVARNWLPRKFEATNVIVTLIGRDRGGHVVSRSVTRVPDFVGSETRFKATLQPAGGEESFDLHLQYKLEDIETNGKQ